MQADAQNGCTSGGLSAEDGCPWWVARSKACDRRSMRPRHSSKAGGRACTQLHADRLRHVG